MTIHKIFARISPLFRRRRMADFMARFHPGKGTRILDVGGYPWCWTEIQTEAHVTVLNIHPFEVMDSMRHRCTALIGDGTNMQFNDGEFDIVFSNSVIEHLHTWEAQQRFAREVRRVGRHYWIQTPAREFFIEPHLLAPFIHWLPLALQLRLAGRFTVWGLIERPTPAQVRDYVTELRLLTFAEITELFPESLVLRERFCGFTKSYVAMTPPEMALEPIATSSFSVAPSRRLVSTSCAPRLPPTAVVQPERKINTYDPDSRRTARRCRSDS